MSTLCKVGSCARRVECQEGEQRVLNTSQTIMVGSPACAPCNLCATVTGLSCRRICHCQVRGLPARADLYDDAQAAALRDLCLNFYDVRATVIEIATRADALRHLSAAEAWRRQLAALEALQVTLEFCEWVKERLQGCWQMPRPGGGSWPRWRRCR